MNHFLLPNLALISSQATSSSGLHVMEFLVDSLLLRGARRGNLQCKVFGGATVQPLLRDIEDRNSESIRKYLSSERINRVSSSLGGSKGRRIRFWPVSGRVQHAWMQDAVGDGTMMDQRGKNEIPFPEHEADI
ncbi:chemotaxis protein CheD [Acetobacter sacchari]|uniref:Chemotaxis protein CheD n=1 Tax=Acetobacter sacchari TaxID=2661687 RepID=A0ABS3LY06_9PROT|nr:chemotaxis protein CheD [Acetobacter sacchari]MBO1360800.1 chemotaxis protein CheD [Acetobacter sacchari]